MPTSKPTNRPTLRTTHKKAAPAKDSSSVLTLLMEDHKKVKSLFAEFKKIREQARAASRKAELVQQICMELTVHAQIEEELFYPAVREGIEDQELMDEAEVEHAGAKDLIAQLLAMEPEDDLYDAKVVVLSESIEHHVEEEEGEMFPQAKQADVLTEELAEQMLQRKQELLTEMAALEESKRKYNQPSEAGRSSQARDAAL